MLLHYILLFMLSRFRNKLAHAYYGFSFYIAEEINQIFVSNELMYLLIVRFQWFPEKYLTIVFFKYTNTPTFFYIFCQLFKI